MCKKVAVVMGSDSDLEVMKPCIQRLKSFEIPVEVRVISAHRTPPLRSSSPLPPGQTVSGPSSPPPARPPIWPASSPPTPPCL